ncbi:MAG: ATP-binding cassette domain-containing protein [Clostridium sp.]|uniref:ABC transporter ATP-binding protein n=1 Tax=Clostridium sp. TaxID=1506 RepID=UPI003051E53F
MNTLKVDKLNYSYGKYEALKDISFEVTDGVIGILGPNGAGKTTAMKLITTLFKAEHGEIFLNDLSYKKDIKEVRKNIGYLPQDFATYGNLKGREFLEIIGSLKLDYDEKSIKSEIEEIVSKLSMNEYIDKKIKEYSGGMKQKLGFAQVLIGSPKLVVVDEPTVGLDPEQRNYIRELFPIISQDRIVLVTTHIIEDIEFYCNYLLVIKDGRLLYKGTKDKFINAVEGLAWECDVNLETYREICNTNKILKTSPLGESMHIQYVSPKPLTSNSKKVSINLQDAYIIHSSLKEKEYSYD